MDNQLEIDSGSLSMNEDSNLAFSDYERPSANRQNCAAYVKLNADKSPPSEIHPFKVGNKTEFNQRSPLTGLYACLFVEEHTNDRTNQYLILDILNNYESDHGHLDLIFLRRLPNFSKATMKILAGGEITFLNDRCVNWNLKSIYSLGNEFHETTGSDPHFEESLKRIWLPRNLYQSIKQAEHYAMTFFSQNGSFRTQPTSGPIHTPNDLVSFIAEGGSFEKGSPEKEHETTSLPTLAPPPTPEI